MHTANQALCFSKLNVCLQFNFRWLLSIGELNVKTNRYFIEIAVYWKRLYYSPKFRKKNPFTSLYEPNSFHFIEHFSSKPTGSMVTICCCFFLQQTFLFEFNRSTNTMKHRLYEEFNSQPCIEYTDFYLRQRKPSFHLEIWYERRQWTLHSSQPSEELNTYKGE